MAQFARETNTSIGSSSSSIDSSRNTKNNGSANGNVFNTKLRANPNKRASIAAALAVKATLGNFEYTNVHADDEIFRSVPSSDETGASNDMHDHKDSVRSRGNIQVKRLSRTFENPAAAVNETSLPPLFSTVSNTHRLHESQTHVTHRQTPSDASSSSSRSVTPPRVGNPSEPTAVTPTGGSRHLRSNPQKRASIAEALAMKAAVGNFEYVSDPRNVVHADASSVTDGRSVVRFPFCQ
jgi:hypothetical protein